MDASPQFLYCGINPLHRPLGTGGGGHMRVCRRGFPSLPRVRRSGAVAVATGPKPSTTLASSPAKSRVPTNGSINGAANMFGNVSDEIKRVRAQMEEDEQLATLMRGLRGQNLSDSQFADENIRLRLVEYAVLITIMILLEAALVGDLFFNKEWKKDLPNDSTGELKNLIAFIEDNMDIFKWAGVSIVVIQALSLFLAVLIRAMIPSRSSDYDSDEDYFVIRRPLLNQQSGQTVGSTSGFHSDIWSSSRMRQKYGLKLNPNQFAYNAGDPKAALHQQQQN